jgi:RHS repeat-associated protein
MFAASDVDGMRAWEEESSIFNYNIYNEGELFGSATSSSSNVMSMSFTQIFGIDGLISDSGSGWSQFYANDPLGNATQADGYFFGNTVFPAISDAYGLIPGTSTSGLGAAFTDESGNQPDTIASGSVDLPLTLMGHREYDANIGRFLNRDPIGYAGGENLYAYADDNPVNEEDPDGTQSAGTRTVLHHSFPKFLGGAPNQPLTAMEEWLHNELHYVDLPAYLNEHFPGMMHKRGNSGRIIQENFSDTARKNTMRGFYNQYKFKYPDAARDFNTICPTEASNLLEKFGIRLFDASDAVLLFFSDEGTANAPTLPGPKETEQQRLDGLAYESQHYQEMHPPHSLL